MAEVVQQMVDPIILMNRVVDEAVGKPAHYSRNCCRFVNHHRLSEARFYETGTADVIWVYCKGNFLREHFQTPEKFNNAVALISLCGEYGGLRGRMEEADAQREFVIGIRYYIMFGEPATFFVRPVPDGAQRGEATNCVDMARVVRALDNQAIGRIAGLQVDHDLPVTIAEAYSYASAEASHRRQENQVVDVTSVIVTVIASLGKQGTMTEEFILNTQQSCMEQFGRRVVIHREVAKLYYTTYTPLMTPDDIARVFRTLLPLIPLTAIRLRTIVEQSRFSGLSSYVIIRDALDRYANFQWGIVEALYPGQFARYRSACIAIAGNPYYAYRHGGMGDAASTKYAVLSWTARSLLIENGDQPELNRYGNGYNRNKYPRIARAIATYVTRPLPVHGDGTLEQPQHPYWAACLEFLQNVANYNTQAIAAVDADGPAVPVPDAVAIPDAPQPAVE